MKNKKYYIKDLEKFIGVYREKIFYWEKVHKILLSKRDPMSNYRYWTSADVEKIKKIITGR